MSQLDVGSGDDLDLLGVEGAIRIVETFRAFTSGSGDILVGFVLPVSPTEKISLSNISDLGDLTNTFISIHAGAKLGKNERNLHSGRIFSPLADLEVVPVIASLSGLGGRLSGFLAKTNVKDTAVGMVVESMSLGRNFTTWRLCEQLGSDIREDLPAEDPDVIDVREDGGLEEVDGGV